MFKLFRNSRLNLLNDGKTNLPERQGRVGKYVKYAIGEIVLVVIGILIALQLNIWNEEKKSHRESNEFTRRLLDEIRINLKQTNNEIQQETSQIRSTKKILDMFHQKKEALHPRVLDSLMGDVITANNLEFNSGTFTEGLNTGKIGAIRSDSLRVALYNFGAILAEIRHHEALDAKDINESFSIFLYKHFNYRKMDNTFSKYKGQLGDTKFTSFDSFGIFDHLEFENMLDNRFYSNNWQLELYETLKNELLRIEHLILQELKA